ncbi:MAG: hypothetical protein QOD75_90 [Blastocatellia bacterium]|jgi:hypothetical protein|nr:hypothetical protein [Blastocatellia bacterium]
MKKLFALVSFLVLAAACTTEPPVNKAPVNANTTPAKSTAPVSEADATAREKAVWDALKKKDMDAFGNMLATDYIEVSDDGVFNKAAIINELKDLAVSDVSFSDWKMLPIDADAVVLTYNATIKGTFKGKAFPEGPYRAASAWVNRDGKWQAFYYQETMVKKAETPTPTPAKAATPAGTPKSTTTPAAKAAEPGPDAVANEKAVWETFKNRDYDAFAAMLAPEFVELEPDGAYDKAGTINGVKMMDAAKFDLSEWKAIKMDDDATLVTYLVRAANGDQDRHSTIWFKRDGKWMGLLHIGTPVDKAPK